MGKKRYDEGGDVEEAGMKEAEPAENFKPTSFKEAFANARRAGEKTFSWQGKSYTTETAGEKKDAPSKGSLGSTLKYGKDVGRRFHPEYPEDASKKLSSEKLSAAANEKRTAQRESMGDTAVGRAFKAIRARGESGAPAYAKGGMTASKRADGIAMRGKTRGKMV